MMKLSVVIVNYNVKYFLEQCLCSVEKSLAGIDGEVIVVDNASRDGSLKYLQERFAGVHFIASDSNLGFARANNLAIKHSRGEYVLLLNPDTIVAEDTFADFIRFMDSHPDAGGCGAYMLRTNGSFALESRRGLPTPFVAFCKMSGLSALFPKSRTFGRYYMRYLDEREANPIEIMSGACMFLRRSVLEKVGLLDEDFFMYGEDIDISYRILKAGYKNYFLPSPILHYKGKSTQKSTYRYVHTFYQAMQLFFNKHYAHYSFLVSAPINIAIWTRAMLAYVGNQFKHRRPKRLKVQSMDCIVIGGDEACSEIKEILAKRHPDGKHLYIPADETRCPDGHLSVDNISRYRMVIYDTKAYSYKTIFRLLAATPGNTLDLGTYTSDTKKLITLSGIF